MRNTWFISFAIFFSIPSFANLKLRAFSNRDLPLPTVSSGTLKAFYKADTGMTLSGSPAVNGGAVDNWTDQSGNGYHLQQSTSSLRPLYQVGQLNGFGALITDGVDDYMQGASAMGITGDVNVTMFVVMKSLNPVVNKGYYGFGDIFVSLNAIGTYCFSSGAQISIAFAGANSYVVNQNESNTYHSETIRKSAGAINTTTTFWLNHTLASDAGGSSTNTPTVANIAFNIGRWGNYTADFGNAGYVEIAIYSGALTTADVTLIQGYLSAKFSIN